MAVADAGDAADMMTICIAQAEPATAFVEVIPRLEKPIMEVCPIFCFGKVSGNRSFQRLQLCCNPCCTRLNPAAQVIAQRDAQNVANFIIIAASKMLQRIIKLWRQVYNNLTHGFITARIA